METKDHEATHSPQQSIQLSSSTVQQDQNQKGYHCSSSSSRRMSSSLRSTKQTILEFLLSFRQTMISPPLPRPYSSYVMPLSNIQGNSQYQKQHFSTDPVPSPVPHQFSYPGSAVSQAPPQSSAPPSQSHSIPCIINILDRVYRMISYNYILQFMNQKYPFIVKFYKTLLFFNFTATTTATTTSSTTTSTITTDIFNA